MKKVLFGVLGLLAVLVAAVLVAPGLVDWNDYKGEIAAAVKAATGRELRIDGDIRVQLIPAPALHAKDVALANLPGASEPEMVRLKSIEVRIALGPLFGLQLQIQSVKLVEPRIALEVLADGRRNWELGLPPAPGRPTSAADKAAPAEAVADSDVLGAIRVDSFTIANGSLTYRDRAGGTVERVEDINANISAASLSGPFEVSGRLKARGFPLEIQLGVGKIIHGRTVPVNAALGFGAGAGRVQIGGTVVSLVEAPRFKGKLKFEAERLSSLAQAVAGGGPLPAPLAQPFLLEGDVQASAKSAEVKAIAVRLGDAQARGNLTLTFGDAVGFQAQLAAGHIDLDKWLAHTAPPPKTGPAAAAAGAVPPRPPATGDKGQKKAQPAEAAGVVLPANVAGSLNLTVEAITFRGGKIGQAKLLAEMAHGEITVSQMSLQAPGGSEMAVFGFVGAPGGKPRFEGEVEIAVSDLRGVLGWLGIEAPALSGDRLRKMNLSSKVALTPEQGQFSNLDLQLDSSRLTGGVTVAFRERPAFGANLSLDRLNLEAYLPKEAAAKPAPAPKPAAPKAKPQAPAAQKKEADKAQPDRTEEAENPFAALAALNDFDANLKLAVEALVYQGTPIRGIALDATLHNGALDVRKFSIGKAAGASASASGQLKGLGGIPEAKNLDFAFAADDLAPLLRIVGAEPPAAARKIGAVALSGRVDGPLSQPRVELVLKAAGAEASVSGTASLSPTGPVLEAAVRAKHADLVRLLGALDLAYRPQGRIGPVEVAAQVKANTQTISFADLKAKAGSAALAGSASVTLAGQKPRIVADLVGGDIAVDPFLPAKRTAQLAPAEPARTGDAALIPAAFAAQPAATAAKGRDRPLLHLAQTGAQGRWPADLIDLAFLGDFDADVKLKAKTLAYESYALENADLAATVASGTLRAERVQGLLFGGPLQAQVQIASAPRTAVEAQIQLRGADVGRAAKALAGSDLASGAATLEARLATGGRTVAELVAALRGTGSFALQDLDVRGSAKGSAMAGAFDLVFGLNQLGGALGGAKQGSGLADVKGSFTIDRGVARSDDLRLVSNVGEGRAAGTVDLPKWTIDVQGEVQVAQNLLTQILTQKAGQPQNQMLPFAVRGALDAPSVKVDTAKLAGGGVALPGVDKLLKQKGVGDVLQGILGVPVPQQPQARPTQPAAPQPQPQQPPQPAPKKIQPQDLLKELLRPK